ncbi:MAG TPA: NAD(P)-dependent alcohol dehydrogenase [Candidatus Sulfomarinibacteraceae bacterium]|nr:NAD(P)-dependent alcohol dehydrogenase [Candidatus Sulfomarinibacteraceae bacterium]
MKAQVLNRYDDNLTAPSWVDYEDVPDPKITKPTDVIVRIGGAGVCRTDLHIIEGVWRPNMDPTGDKLLPMIMGHENAGWIEEVGSGVEGLEKGDPVIVHPKITGGLSLVNRRGHDMIGPGLFPGLDSSGGGYAEAMVTSVRNIVKLPRTLVPKEVAPFADAGLTAYRVVKRATRDLMPGQFCVVIGVGGLGHIGIQCLKAMCAADVIVVARSDASLALAKENGADYLVKADDGALDAVMSLTKGEGAEVVIDFVGERGTTSLGLSMTRAMGDYYIVGYGENINIPAVDLIISERSIKASLVGTWAELNELMSLADHGLVKLAMQEYALKDANRALKDLSAGKVNGRAVLVP